MRDKKFLLFSGIIVFCTLLLSIYTYRFIEQQAVINMKNSDKNPIYFGATYMTMNNPFFAVVNNEIKSVVEAQGDVLLTMDSALSVDKQIEQIQYLINQNVKVLFINPLDINVLHDILEECEQKGIIVIAVDTNLKEDDFVSYSVISDNYQAGVDAATHMMNTYDRANIVLLEHSAAVSGLQRIKGFVDTISNHKDYRVVARKECEGQLELATPAMDEIIKSGVEFDVVMSLNDPAALGAMAAMQAYNINDVSVYGVDGTPEIKMLINDGKPIVSVAQSPIMMGEKAVEVAYEILNGKTYSKKTFLIPVTLISKENINDFSLEGWQ